MPTCGCWARRPKLITMGELIWRRQGLSGDNFAVTGMFWQFFANFPAEQAIRRTIAELCLTFHNIDPGLVDMFLHWGAYFWIQHTEGNPPPAGHLFPSGGSILGDDLFHYERARMRIDQGANNLINYVACPATFDMFKVDTPTQRARYVEQHALYIGWSLPEETIEALADRPYNVRWAWRMAVLIDRPPPP